MRVTICDSDVKWVKEYARVRDLLMEANQYGDGRHGEDELIQGLLTHDYMLWTTDNSAAVFQVVVTQASARKDLIVFMAGGDLQEITDAEPHVVEFARGIGCTHIQTVGRKGWQRALATQGYEFASVTLIKEL